MVDRAGKIDAIKKEFETLLQALMSKGSSSVLEEDIKFIAGMVEELAVDLENDLKQRRPPVRMVGYVWATLREKLRNYLGQNRQLLQKLEGGPTLDYSLPPETFLESAKRYADGLLGGLYPINQPAKTEQKMSREEARKKVLEYGMQHEGRVTSHDAKELSKYNSKEASVLFSSMSREELVKRVKKGTYEITDKGRQYLEK